MKFTCNTAELTRALDIVGRALSSRPALKIYENVLIDGNGDTVTLRTADGTLYMTVDVMAYVDEPGTIALEGKLFADCVRKQNGDEITIQTEKNGVLIKCGRSKTQIALQDADAAPNKPKPKASAVTVTVPGSKLRSCIEYVDFAVSRDETRRILTGVLLEITDCKMRTVGLDGFRLAKMEADCDYTGEPIKAVLPRAAAMELAKLAKDDSDVSLTFDGVCLTATVNHIEMTMLTIAGEYIEWRRIVPSDSATRAKLNASQLRECAERAQIMANRGKNNLIRLTFNQNCVILTSRADMGDVYDEADCDLDGADMRIAFNCGYLMDALKAEAGNEIEMNLRTPDSACVIRGMDGENDRMQLILPVRELG